MQELQNDLEMMRKRLKRRNILLDEVVLRLAPWFAMVNDGAALERSILSASQCDAGICRVRRELFLRECSPPHLARKWQRPGVTRAIRTEPSSRDAAGEAFISPPPPSIVHLRRACAPPPPWS